MRRTSAGPPVAEWVGVNASPLIVLAKVRRLDLLDAAGDRLVTTQAVMRVLKGNEPRRRGGAAGRPRGVHCSRRP